MAKSPELKRSAVEYLSADRKKNRNKIGETMKDWYKNITKGQKIWIYLASTAAVLVWGIGLLPLAVLIYLELGQRGE